MKCSKSKQRKEKNLLSNFSYNYYLNYWYSFEFTFDWLSHDLLRSFGYVGVEHFSTSSWHDEDCFFFETVEGFFFTFLNFDSWREGESREGGEERKGLDTHEPKISLCAF